MASKTRIALLCAAAVLPAGCATVRDKPSPPPSSAAQPAPTPARAPATSLAVNKPKPRTAPRPVPRTTPPPAPQTPSSDLPGMIGSGAKWEVPGQTVTVNRAGAATTQPVPLFRQAGVLASVRAALAGSPAQPQAEFRHGVLTLTFNSANNDEVAAAVNKAMAVPEARRLQVSLQP